MNRTPPIDEHDFYQGKYLAATPVPSAPAIPAPPAAVDANLPPAIPAPFVTSAEPPKIEIEVTISHLTPEQRAKFVDYVEFWDSAKCTLYQIAQPAGVDAATITEALRVTFIGCYDAEEDDFEGKTYFTRSLSESPTPVSFSKKHKQICGFLYLRSLRTGSRALSLERGSLLDIVLRLKEVRPQMWEDTIATLASYSVASDPNLGLSGVLESINESLKRYVPKEWGIKPHLKVSSLTREHLRKVITAFIATGEGEHAAPFFRQGTGTINMLVLAMLSQIAQDKQNVIFAMEEPETAIPPYAQKRIVHEIRKLASQTLFTSHSRAQRRASLCLRLRRGHHCGARRRYEQPTAHKETMPMMPSLADRLYDRTALRSLSDEVIASLRLTDSDKSRMRGACRHLMDALDRCPGITLQQRWHDFEKTVWPRWASNIDRPCTLWTWGARVLVPARIVVPSMEWLRELRVNQWIVRFPEDDALVQQHRLLLDATADIRWASPHSRHLAVSSGLRLLLVRGYTTLNDIQDDDLKQLARTII
ncbi:ATP-dependent nuclease [Tunturiibacter empetritectus]|uniref:Uncharacterized protein n=1 Tax=Tunturiibacter lichenicola TaxID=2051959 RepID=A0A7W8JBT4_9BACT|nr:ATP-binding protein [Edaphobacter lichenicola]MBB5346285.1 hypothetical protein [Edaphobacter lichenicola]